MHTAPKRVVGTHAPSSHAVHVEAQYPPGDCSDAAMHSSPFAHARASLHAPPLALVTGAVSLGTTITAASTTVAICTAGGGAPEHAAKNAVAVVNMKQRFTVVQ